jgi:hypothetical protein
MKIFYLAATLVFIATTRLFSCVKADDSYYKLGFKIYLLNNFTYTQIDLLAYSNATKFWGVLNQIDFEVASEWDSVNRTQRMSQNSSVALLALNETVKPFYF